MKNVNRTVRAKFYELLSPVVGVPVYYKYFPSRISADAYILITAINNNDNSTINTNNTDTSIQIGIYTKDTQANAGVVTEDIADIIYATIYPNPQSKVDLSPDFQNTVLSVVNDVSPDVIVTNEAVFINRFITFRLNILQL